MNPLSRTGPASAWPAARALLAANDFAGALSAYTALVRAFPLVAGVWFDYGAAAAGLRRWDLADSAWNRTRELAPRDAELIAMIGHRYQGARRPERARECFAQAAAADPRAINPRISLAVLLERGHDLAAAREAVAACLAIDARDEQARYLQAVLDRRAGDSAGAERGLRDLLTPEPAHPFVRYAARYE